MSELGPRGVGFVNYVEDFSRTDARALLFSQVYPARCFGKLYSLKSFFGGDLNPSFSCRAAGIVLRLSFAAQGG